MIDEPKAPRLHAYFQRTQRRSILTMARSEWEALGVKRSTLVEIDVRWTPMGTLATEASVVATVAQQFSSARAEVAIYRCDQKDQPTPVNVDHYLVWLDLGSDQSLPGMIAAASTEDNENLREYLRRNVFLVKQNAGLDHWLPELPASVRAIIDHCASS